MDTPNVGIDGSSAAGSDTPKGVRMIGGNRDWDSYSHDSMNPNALPGVGEGQQGLGGE